MKARWQLFVSLQDFQAALAEGIQQYDPKRTGYGVSIVNRAATGAFQSH